MVARVWTARVASRGQIGIARSRPKVPGSVMRVVVPSAAQVIDDGIAPLAARVDCRRWHMVC